MNTHLKRLLVFVLQHIISEANNSLISEYAKRESSWKRLQEVSYSEDLKQLLESYLISEMERDEREKEKDVDTNDIESTIFVISEIYKLGLKFWDGFKIYLDRNKSEDYMTAFELHEKLKKGKNLLPKDISFGKRTLALIQENPPIVDEIKSLSKLEETITIEIKPIYDKLLLWKKDDWDKWISLADQTKILNNIELANVKSVRISLTKRELIKEQALLKAYESLKKLKKFGLKI